MSDPDWNGPTDSDGEPCLFINHALSAAKPIPQPIVKTLNLRGKFMPIYTFCTERKIEVVAENENEANSLIQRELHREEIVVALISTENEG